MEFTINQLAGLLGGKVQGNGDGKINMLAKIQDAKQGQIAFLSNPKYEQFIYSTEASAVIVKNDFVPKKEVSCALILVDDPYLSFTALLEEYHKLISFQKVGVEEPSFIGQKSTTGEGIYRGAFSYIGANVKIGSNVKIYPQAFIGDDCEVGDNTVIHSGVKIYASTRIGRHCVIHSGTVIGSDGFGFAPQADGSYKTIPQLGNVILEDYVTIGANTVLDCATMMGDSTIIRQGVKLDNLIQIAHNVEIGKNTVIAAQAGIAGSTKVGERSVIGGQVGIGGHLVLADNISVGAQAGIGKTNTQPGEKLMGSPAIGLTEYYKAYAVFRNLPDIAFRLKDLERKMADLPARKEAIQS
jgi:UDP-3-O-[3-hydroxymyristoyl] glucosamine N-acyltransferase